MVGNKRQADKREENSKIEKRPTRGDVFDLKGAETTPGKGLEKKGPFRNTLKVTTGYPKPKRKIDSRGAEGGGRFTKGKKW